MWCQGDEDQSSSQFGMPNDFAKEMQIRRHVESMYVHLGIEYNILAIFLNNLHFDDSLHVSAAAQNSFAVLYLSFG